MRAHGPCSACISLCASLVVVIITIIRTDRCYRMCDRLRPALLPFLCPCVRKRGRLKRGARLLPRCVAVYVHNVLGASLCALPLCVCAPIYKSGGDADSIVAGGGPPELPLVCVCVREGPPLPLYLRPEPRLA